MFRFLSNNRTEMQVVSAGAGGRELVRNFQFDLCASEDMSQDDFFNLSGITTLLDSALEGYLATVFAYGQTGSGKTYSMSGLEEKLGLSKERTTSQDYDDPSDGLIPRSIRYLFQSVASKSPDTTFSMKASYCEIYNEQAYDLLNAASGALNVRWNDRNGFYVQNLLVVQCDSMDDVMAVVDEGHRNRRHEMNKDSSRSHSILTITLDQEVLDPNDGHSVVKYGKMSFVDLAGSERLRDTKSANAEETSSINKSLLTLGKVIAALGTKSNTQVFVPYRDSKLTKLLMDSLGGNSLTLMIACVSPSPVVMEDTLSTLNYATRAKNIQNKPTVQMDPKESLILGLRKEPPTRIAPLSGRVPNMPEHEAPPSAADFDSLNGVMSAYQSQLIFLQQENAQLHANQGYSEHRLKSLMCEL
ncbi:hypothetical protein DYB36_004275 [Aphanomyces astaci]|uniref:Kinesin-like protein n=1 Tax=Aphanomyces astaci TaxID=112090 RepID=A0A396ZW41_APHAT|nr:hypothetical protein DYB36_004275 [Aphanomyces astaci]